ncbi:MAG: hypothetical protein R3C17_12265 [Planctomycetaceae bacterium]
MQFMRRFIYSAGLAAVVAGCGDSIRMFPVAVVTGKVLCNGQPVQNIRVYFNPIASGGSAIVGKPGMGVTKADGTFVITTYSSGDGAVVGRHNVMLAAPHPENFPQFDCPCQTSGNKPVQQVEVQESGENNFQLNMPEKVGKEAPGIDREDLEDLMDED